MQKAYEQSSTRAGAFWHLLGQLISLTHTSYDGIAQIASKLERCHSHSIVPGGFDVTSYTTLFTPFTSLMIRVAVSPRNFMSKA